VNIDKDGYIYEYDYENRITKITKGETDIAEFAYVEDPPRRDALGRRIKKRDSVAGTTNIYCYNDKWQVLCDYNDTGAAGTAERWFAYGNGIYPWGIDEVLIMGTGTGANSMWYYGHDHLYSPVFLAAYNGVVYERYEYDAYGNCQVLEPNFAPDPDGITDYGNPYLFTASRLDILDNGSLKLQYNRNRYYDQYTGRWLTHDPLLYADGMNLYEYVGTHPTQSTDPLGLAWTTSDFVGHYFSLGFIDGEWLWPGDPVDLASVGLLGAFRSAPSVAAAVSGFRSMVPGVVSILQAELALGCLHNICGSRSAALSWSAKTTTNVYLVPSLFAVGRSTFYRDGICRATANCDCSMVTNWSYTCTLEFSIRDVFKEPLDIEGVEITGGVPYPINASWTQTITWPVPPVPIGPIIGGS